MASYIVNDKWYFERKEDIEVEAECIVIAAAKIIRAEIREKNYDSKSYATNEDIANIDNGREWIPHHLQTFLKITVQPELKQNSHWSFYYTICLAKVSHNIYIIWHW